MPKVFISYVREDRALVDKLVQGLESNGVDVWIDRKDLRPGHRWADAIRRGISEGDFFLACFSTSYSDRSKSYMNEELTHAIEELRQRPMDQAWFIPLRLSESEIPARSIGAGETLRSLQWVDLFVDWDEGIRQILSVVRPQAEPLRIEQRDIAILMHQIMGPLVDIAHSIERLRTKSLSEEEQKTYSDRIHTEAILAINQLQSLQAVTLLLQAEPRIFRSTIDLAQEIKGAVAVFYPLAKESALEFRFRGLEQLPKRFSADRKLMQVLFFTVLDNAVRYSFKNAPIMIEARRKALDIRLEFTNRGFPIADAEERHRVFEYGYRSAKALAVNPVGTGRGLFLARRIVLAHEGEISLESRSEDRNVVSIRLPLDRGVESG